MRWHLLRGRGCQGHDHGGVMPEDLSPFNLTGISAADKETITIGTTNGDIAPAKQYVVVAAFSGTADNLDRIETSGILSPGDADGAVLYLRADAGDTITIRHNQGAGQHYNILIPTEENITLTGNTILECVYDISLDTDGAWVVRGLPQRSRAFFLGGT